VYLAALVFTHVHFKMKLFEWQACSRTKNIKKLYVTCDMQRKGGGGEGEGEGEGEDEGEGEGGDDRAKGYQAG
jgi:hypothetical protein